MLKNFLKLLHNQRAQMMVLYALLVPLLFTVGGAAVDLGWYYMNVSRLQNIADSAVIAGADVLVHPLKGGELTDYTYGYLLPKVPNTADLTESNRFTDTGDNEAKKYIKKNLEGNVSWNGDKIQDNYNNSELKFAKTLYEKPDDDYKPLYYEIELTEKHNHLFSMFDSFDMVISVKSAAKFTHNKETPDSGPTLYEQMEELKAAKIYADFYEIQEEYKQIYDKSKSELIEKYISEGYSQADAEELAKTELGDRYKTTFKQAQKRTVQTSGNWWQRDLATYRTESNTVRGIGGPDWNIDQLDIDDLFIDFKVDVSYKFFTSDWDLDMEPPKGLTYSSDYNKIFDGSKKETDDVRYKYRIHSIIGIEPKRDKSNRPTTSFPYKVRKDMGRVEPDPLYARIESEQIKLTRYSPKDLDGYNSVHQIIINVNQSNIASDDRPMVFFYDGPDKIDENSSVRDSKPVILHLNADFRGVLYAPNSPVVICGNNKNFKGFVVAKEFRKLKSADEFKDEGYEKVVRKDKQNYVGEYDEIFVRPSDIKTSDSATIPENCIAVTRSNGESGYIKRTCEHFTKVTVERVDGRKDAALKIDYTKQYLPEMYVGKTGEVALSDEKITATVNGADTDKPKYSDDVDKIFNAVSDFDLASSTFDSFLLLKMVNYTYLNQSGTLDNFFTTDRAKIIY